MEKSAWNALFNYDREIRKNFGIFCGVDEAGRGPLAGDVFAAAVILPSDALIEGIDDSKKLSERKREELFDVIIGKSSAFSIAVASVAEIEEYNILNAALLAMKRAVEKLGLTPDFALIDGNVLPDLNIPARALIKGDSISASVAAASILAKVSRDRYMRELARKYPQYFFDKHKGYGTKLHYEMIAKHGICPVHRLSFLKKLKIN